MAVVQAGSCSSDSTPILGTSICCRCSPKKQKSKITCSLKLSHAKLILFLLKIKLDKNKMSIFIIVSLRHQSVSYNSLKDNTKRYWIKDQIHLRVNGTALSSCIPVFIQSTHTECNYLWSALISLIYLWAKSHQTTKKGATDFDGWGRERIWKLYWNRPAASIGNIKKTIWRQILNGISNQI